MNDSSIITKKIFRKLLADNYDLGKILKIEFLKTSGNFSYIVSSEKGKYILRLSSSKEPRKRSKDEILAEVDLLQFLIKKDFPVLKPVLKINGEVLLSYKNQNGYLRHFCGADFILNPNSRQIKKFGELLGKFHKAVKNFKTRHKRSHRWGLEETRKNFIFAKRIILKSKFSDKKKFIYELAGELRNLSFSKNLPKGMIHEDLGKRHILWQKNRICAILDFDRSYEGYFILDLGQAARGWCFVKDWRGWSQKNFEILVRAYQAQRRLNKIERQCLFNAIKFALLERSLSFALRGAELNKKDDWDFANYSIFNLVGQLENNKEKINTFLKT